MSTTCILEGLRYNNVRSGNHRLIFGKYLSVDGPPLLSTEAQDIAMEIAVSTLSPVRTQTSQSMLRRGYYKSGSPASSSPCFSINRSLVIDKQTQRFQVPKIQGFWFQTHSGYVLWSQIPQILDAWTLWKLLRASGTRPQGLPIWEEFTIGSPALMRTASAQASQ